MEEEIYFPMDVVEEILWNLPVKSLMRFRCVSKSWKRKISEPRFIRKHATRPEQLGLVVCPDGILAADSYYCSLSLTTSRVSMYPPSSPNYPSPVCVTKIFCPFEQPYMVHTSAFCDELWLISIRYESYFLWNPSLRTYRKLPEKPPTWQPQKKDWWSGVGYDSVADDYKVFMAPCRAEFKLCEQADKQTHLYSLRNDAWTKLDDAFALLDSSYSMALQSAQYFDGTLHWVVYPVRRDLDYVIVTFDLRIEKYAELPRPPNCPLLHRCDRHCPFYDDDQDHDNAGVAVLKGMFCVVLSYLHCQPHDQRLLLWAMTDYGVAESWTQLYEIRYDAHRSCFIPSRGIVLPLPLYIFDNGDVLILTNTSTIVIYTDDHTPLRTLAVYRPPRFTTEFFFALLHAQTLVSPLTPPSL